MITVKRSKGEVWLTDCAGSTVARSLVVSAYSHSRNLLSKEEKTVLKQMAVRVSKRSRLHAQSRCVVCWRDRG